MAALAIPLGLTIGLSVGTVGGGGSVLAVPVLVYLLGQSVREATTASLLIVTAGAVTGGLRHARDGRVCWQHAMAFIAAALPGLIAGTALGDAVGGRALIAAFAVAMIAAAAAMWRKTIREDVPVAIRRGQTCPPVCLARTIAAGAVAGALTGFLGVGGGFLIVPVLVIGLALTTRLAIGTSLAIVAAISLLGLAVHLLAGRSLEVGVTMTMTVACAVGALAGATLSGHLSQRLLGRGFALLLTAVAGYLLASAAFLGGPPGS